MITKLKDYLNHSISFDDFDGKFSVKINGETKFFSSLKSAENAIEKLPVKFKPVDVLIVDWKGWYNKKVYSLKQVRLESYGESKGWYRGQILRYYITDEKTKIYINNTHIYPLSAKKKLQAILTRLNELEATSYEIQKEVKRLEKQQDKLVTSYDPKPEVRY